MAHSCDLLPHKPHPVRGVFAGFAAGLVASWIMNGYLAGITMAQEALATPAEKAANQASKASASDDSTQVVADTIAQQITAKHLSKQQKQVGGPLVHYAFGGLMGAIYGALAEYSPASRLGAGSLFGAVLFLGADEIAVPALGLGKPPSQVSAGSQANHLAAHVVYGTTVELLRSTLRHWI